MHDELLERRLRAALHDEAGALPFTITAAELERRAVLRGRGAGNRRLALLLAAAVGIGLVGFGSVLGGLVPRPIEATPQPSAVAAPTDEPSTPVAADRLPDLSELVRADDPAVVVAQAHGRADGPSPLPTGVDLAGATVGLGDLRGSTTYEVTLACLGAGRATLDVRVPSSPGPLSGPEAACDGAVQRQTINAAGLRALSLHLSDESSWRIVVRRVDGVPPPPLSEHPILQAQDDEQELLRAELETPTAGGSAGPPQDGLSVVNLESLPTRAAYRVQLWCEGGTALRYLHVDPTHERFVVSTSTQVACDGNVHSIALGFPEIFGAPAYLAATPGSRVAVVVTSAHPPISLATEQPGWQMSTGFGPHLDYEGGTQMFTGIGSEDGGPVLVAFACASTTLTEIDVEVAARSSDTPETFTAQCTPDGATTSQSFESSGISVDLTFTTTPGTWTAMSILVPDP